MRTTVPTRPASAPSLAHRGLARGLAQDGSDPTFDYDTVTGWVEMLKNDENANDRLDRLAQDPDLTLYSRSGPIRFQSREELRSFLEEYDPDAMYGPLFPTRLAELAHRVGTDWRYQAAAGGALALAGITLYNALT